MAETDRFFDERRCLVEGTGEVSTVSLDALGAADCRFAERLVPTEGVESRRNQLPVAETADLRTAAITFSLGGKNCILDLVVCFC
ncbi:MAG: hypothetical protein RMY34_04195 [Aulosira sp. DedQUE10]|nr:hypothetical protein [Aulosira sp. DedQUE10]